MDELLSLADKLLPRMRMEHNGLGMVRCRDIHPEDWTRDKVRIDLDSRCEEEDRYAEVETLANRNRKRI